jgi:glutamate 5-kinase
MSSKLEAAQLAAQCGTHIVIATGLANQAIARLFDFSGADEAFPATFILAHPDKTQNTLKRWIGLASGYAGILTVNQGAKAALLARGASLLAVGVVAVEGDFAVHQVVSLQDETGLEFGRGVVQFSAQALQDMLEKPKAAIANLDVIHRSKLFLSGDDAL